MASLPPMKTAVRTASRGERENIASWTSGIIVFENDIDIGSYRIIAGIERHVHVEWAHVLQRA